MKVMVDNLEVDQVTPEMNQDAYRETIRKLISAEIKNALDEEIRKAAQELRDESRNAIRLILEEHKAAIRQVVDEEKKAIWAKADALRKSISRMGLFDSKEVEVK